LSDIVLKWVIYPEETIKSRLGKSFDFTYKKLAKSQKCHKKSNNSKTTDFRKKTPLGKIVLE